MKTFVRMTGLCVVVVVVLFAVIINGARIISIFAPNFVDSINRHLEPSDITLSGLTVRWSGFDPIIELDSIHHPHFSINDIKAKVDLFRSVARNRLVFGIVHIEALQVQPPQDWRDCSLDSPSFNSETDFGVLAMLLESRTIDIQFGSSIHCREQEYKHFGTLHKRTNGSRVDVKLVVTQFGDCGDCAIKLRYVQHASGWLSRQVDRELDVTVNEFPLLPFLFGFDFLKELLVDVELRWRSTDDSGAGQANIAIVPKTVNSQTSPTSLVAELHTNCLPTHCQGALNSSLMYGKLDIASDIPSISYYFDTQRQHLLGSSDSVPLSLITEIMDTFGKSDGEVYRWTNSLSPKGTVEQVHVLMDQEGFAYRAIVNDLLLNSFNNFPKISTERVEIVGFNQVHNFNFVDSPTELTLARWFTKPWSIETTNLMGVMEFDEESLALKTTGNAKLLNGDQIAVSFGLRHEFWRATTDFGTIVELSSTTTDQLAKYLPNKSDNVIRYIQNSLKQGEFSDIVLTLHRSNANHSRRQVLSFGVQSVFEEVDMHYYLDWPPLFDAGGTLSLNQDALHVQLQTGELGFNSLDSSEIYFPLADSVVHLSVHSDTSAEHLLNLLHGLELHDSEFFDWSDITGAGPVNVEAQLDIPIGNSNPTPFTCDIVVVLAEVTLTHEPFNLTLTELTGDLRFTSPNLLSSGQLSAKFFDQPMSMQLQPRAQPSEAVSTHVDFEFSSTPTTVSHFLGPGFGRNVTGATTVYGYLETTIQADEASKVVLESDLLGMGVQLPLPIGKLKEETKPTTVEISIQKTPIFELHSGNLQAHITTDEVGVLKGKIGFNVDPTDLTLGDYDWVIAGEIDQLDLSTLQLNEASSNNFPQIRIQELKIADILNPAFQLTNNTLFGEISNNSIQLTLLSDELDAVLSKTPEERLNLAITKFQHKKRAPASSTPIDTSQLVNWIPSMDVVVEQIQHIDEEGQQIDFGTWSGSVDVHNNSVVVADLTATIQNLSIKPLSNQSEVLVWDTNAGTTSFSAVLFGENLIDSLQQFEIDGEVESREFEVKTDIKWQGSPFDFNSQHVNGTLEAKIDRGRFAEADVGVGARRITSLLNIAPIIQQLRVDFRNMFKEGFIFDRVFVKAYVDNAVISITDETPFEIESRSSDILFSGTVNFDTQAVQGEIVVRLPLSASLPFYVAIVTGNPTLVLGTWLGKTVFADQIDRIASHKYRVSGTIDDPEVEFVGLFTDELSSEEIVPPNDTSEPATEEEN